MYALPVTAMLQQQELENRLLARHKSNQEGLETTNKSKYHKQKATKEDKKY